MAESGQNTQEYQEAMQKLGEIDAEVSRAKTLANQLIADARKILAEAGNSFTQLAEVVFNLT